MLMSWMSRLYGAGSGWHLLRGVCSKLVNQLSRVNNITAKLTNQFTQTGLSTFDWQHPFTWLWWWLPLRLSKRQSPLPTTVLLRTTITRTIKLHYYMLPPGSNHLLKNSSFNLYVLSEYELISSWIFVYCILQHTEMELIKNVSKWYRHTILTLTIQRKLNP